MKKLLAILLLLPSFAFAQSSLICTPVGKTIECDFYFASLTSSVDVQYVDLVPAGETRPLRITAAFILPFYSIYGGGHSLVVESPTGSGKWKVPLCATTDKRGACLQNFVSGILLLSTDELCYVRWNDTGAGGLVSFSIHYIIGP